MKYLEQQQIYNEIALLPSSLQNEIAKNYIYDKIKLSVKKIKMKIYYRRYFFIINYYHWNNLKLIETIIDNMFECSK